MRGFNLRSIVCLAATMCFIVACHSPPPKPTGYDGGPQICQVQDPPDYDETSLDMAILAEERASMGIMADVSFCQHDPGHNPNWQYWKDQKDVPVECPGGHVDQTCQDASDADYDDVLKMYDDDYRRGVCTCWSLYPSNSVSDTLNRATCIAGKMYDFSYNMNAFYTFYKNALVAECDCVLE